MRYDELNAVALDFGCHQHFHENPREFEAWFKSLLGERAFTLLEARASIVGKPDIEGIWLWLKKVLEVLR